MAVYIVVYINPSIYPQITVSWFEFVSMLIHLISVGTISVVCDHTLLNISKTPNTKPTRKWTTYDSFNPPWDKPELMDLNLFRCKTYPHVLTQSIGKRNCSWDYLYERKNFTPRDCKDKKYTVHRKSTWKKVSYSNVNQHLTISDHKIMIILQRVLHFHQYLVKEISPPPFLIPHIQIL